MINISEQRNASNLIGKILPMMPFAQPTAKEQIIGEDLTIERSTVQAGANSNKSATTITPVLSDNVKEKNRQVLVRSVSGSKNATVGDIVKYKVTKFSVSDPTEKEKKMVNWKIKSKTSGKTIKVLKLYGDVLEIDVGKDWSGFEVLIMPYINSPTEKVSVLSEVERNKTWDKVTDNRIKTLHPDLIKDAFGFVNRVEDKLDITIRVTHGYRSFDEQDALYAQGRDSNGNIIGETVTNAEGGESYHNYGVALDIVEIKDGAANWNAEWENIAKIGKEFNFEWGGDFTSITDKPHFQNKFSNSTNALLNKLNDLDSGETYADIEL